MSSYSENNKRIFRNTLMLYIRMLFTVVVSLYTSRVVLDTIGIDDYGIYNLVGGIVVLFSFLNSALTSATQRFLTFELGNNDTNGFQKVFSLSILIYVGLSLIIVVLLETIGLWFLNTQLKIPAVRMQAANWVYQFSILAFVFSILRTPYNATVIAYERMSFFAYVSIIEVVLKLLIVYLLLVICLDKLVLYSILVTVVTLLISICYYIYCTFKLQNCRFSYVWDNILFKRLLNFSSWSLFGSFSVVATNQGLNMALNMFFGIVVNAAMGIANQVNAVSGQLLGGFQTAFNPQIVKYYAMNDRDGLLKLIYRSSKFSYFLLMFISIPLLMEMPFVLSLWLHTVPEYTIEFCRLLLIASLFEALSGPFWMTIQATGEIKQYQLIVSFLFLLNLFIPCLLFFWGGPPVVAFIVRVVVSVLIFGYRFWVLSSKIDLSIEDFSRRVLLPSLGVTLLSFFFPSIIFFYSGGMTRFAMVMISSLLSSSLCIYLLGLTVGERKYIRNNLISNIIK